MRDRWHETQVESSTSPGASATGDMEDSFGPGIGENAKWVESVLILLRSEESLLLFCGLLAIVVVFVVRVKEIDEKARVVANACLLSRETRAKRVSRAVGASIAKFAPVWLLIAFEDCSCAIVIKSFSLSTFSSRMEIYVYIYEVFNGVTGHPLACPGGAFYVPTGD